jgi:PAS domain S-box-containing protein
MRSLFWRVFLSQLLILVIALGVISSLLSTKFQDFYLHLSQDQLAERARDLAVQLQPVVVNPPPPEQLAGLVRVLSALGGVEMCLTINHAGRTITVTQNGCNHSGVGAGAASAPIGQGVVVPGAMNPSGQELLAARVPFAEHRGELIVTTPLSDAVDKTVRRLHLFLLYGASVATGLALLVALAVSDRISGPLRRITWLAHRMEEGDFSQRLELRDRSEIGTLGRSFDSLAGSLEATLASLREEQARLRGILASVAEGIVAVDAEGTVALINPQAATLLGLQAAAGAPMSEIGLPEAVATAFSECLQSNELQVLELQCGEPPRHLLLHIAPVRVEETGRWGAVAAVDDITETRRLEQMRRQFISDASHEIRTPLTAIGGFAAAIADGTAATEEERTRAAAFIMRETERLSRLVNDLLDLSRIESGAVELKLEEVDLSDLIRDAVEGFGVQFQESGITVELSLPSDAAPVRLDPDRIYQVLVNLISNALRFNRDHGKITISVAPRRGAVQVTVRDTGVGIPPEELPHIWERFHRADTSRARADGGTGLGLAIVRSIVQRHGGTIAAESEVGRGSAFSFTLPVR